MCSSDLGAEKVAEFLKNQASRYGIDLEVVVATEKEINEIQAKIMETFKQGNA